MVVVEVEGGRIVEKHLADLAVEGTLVNIDFEMQLFGRFFHIFPELQKVALARESLRLKQDFVFAVVNYVVGQMLGLRMLAYVLVHLLHHAPMIGRAILASDRNYPRHQTQSRTV